MEDEKRRIAKLEREDASERIVASETAAAT